MVGLLIFRHYFPCLRFGIQVKAYMVGQIIWVVAQLTIVVGILLYR